MQLTTKLNMNQEHLAHSSFINKSISDFSGQWFPIYIFGLIPIILEVSGLPVKKKTD